MTVCNQNQFRRDRIPKNLDKLLRDFLIMKIANMLGGTDKLEEFLAGNYEIKWFTI